ncbi:MAG: cell division protein FtsQ/DivIB [Thermodesulfobacteriota bacterium]
MKDKKNLSIFRAFIFLGIIVISISFCINFFRSTSFIVEEIVINGNKRVSNNEIIKRSGIRAGVNTIFFYEGSAVNALLKNSWIKDVKIFKEYPSKVVINIEEEEPFCIVVSDEGQYFYISRDGTVLGEINKKEGMDYPVISTDGRYDDLLILDAIGLLKLSKHSNILNWKEISEVKVSNKFGIRLITNDQRYIDFGKGNFVTKWHKVERIINESRNINLVEQYINISSEKLGIVDFNI